MVDYDDEFDSDYDYEEEGTYADAVGSSNISGECILY